MKFIASLAIVFFMLACKRSTGVYEFEGVVNDNTNGTVMTDVTVDVYTSKAGSSIPTFLKSVTTNAEGKFSFEIERGIFEELEVRIEPENYFKAELAKSLNTISLDEVNVVDMNTTAKSWVNINFSNPGGNPTDEITYTIQEGKVCAICCSKSQTSVVGAGDTTINCITDGDTYYSLYYVHGTQNNIVGVQTVAFDTVDLNINY